MEGVQLDVGAVEESGELSGEGRFPAAGGTADDDAIADGRGVGKGRPLTSQLRASSM